jgi:hypothetical protein
VRNRGAEKTNIVVDNMGGNNVPNSGQAFMSSLLNILDNDTWYITLGTFVHLSHRKDWLKYYIEIPPM